MTMSKDIKDRLIDALITAFVFAAALSWRDTLLNVVTETLPEGMSTLWADVLVTLVITGIVLLLVYVLLKSSRAVDNKFGLKGVDPESK